MTYKSLVFSHLTYENQTGPRSRQYIPARIEERGSGEENKTKWVLPVPSSHKPVFTGKFIKISLTKPTQNPRFHP